MTSLQAHLSIPKTFYPRKKPRSEKNAGAAEAAPEAEIPSEGLKRER